MLERGRDKVIERKVRQIKDRKEAVREREGCSGRKPDRKRDR